MKNKGEESLDLIIDALRESGDLDETLGVVESVKLLIRRSLTLTELTRLNQERSEEVNCSRPLERETE